MGLITASLAIAFANAFAWITPGPNMLAVINLSLSQGRRHGFYTAAGLSVASFIWAALAVFGASVVFELYPSVTTLVKVVGGCYLLYLGFRSLRAASKASFDGVNSEQAEKSIGQSFYVGFVVSMTNPKAALFFGSVLTSFVPADAPQWYLLALAPMLGILAMVQHSITATVFSTDSAVTFFRKFQRQITRVFGTIFLLFGALVIRSALKSQ